MARPFEEALPKMRTSSPLRKHLSRVFWDLWAGEARESNAVPVAVSGASP